MSLALNYRPTPRRQAQMYTAMRLYVQEGSQKQAAHRMGISHSYFQDLLRDLYASLGVGSHLDALRVLGWVTTPEEE